MSKMVKKRRDDKVNSEADKNSTGQDKGLKNILTNLIIKKETNGRKST